MAAKTKAISRAVVIDRDVTPPPSMDTDERKDAFSERADMLSRIGIWHTLDADALAAYVLAREEYMGLSSLVSQLVRDGECSEEIRSAQILQDTACRQMRGFAADLGLTASARARIAKVRADDKTEVDF